MGELEGRRILVTGAAQGLGADIVRVLSREGARVAVADIRADGIESVVAEIGPTAIPVSLDVTDPASWESAVGTVKRELGGIDGLINNAGVVKRGGLLATTDEEYDWIVAINQTGPFLGMKAVLPEMIAAGYGSIVNVASVAGFRVTENRAIYSATKHAVVAMTKSAALEHARDGIRVNAVCPGPMRTPMLGASSESFIAALGNQTAMGRIGQSMEVAELVAFVSSDRASFCTGAEFVADGGWSAGFRDES